MFNITVCPNHQDAFTKCRSEHHTINKELESLREDIKCLHFKQATQVFRAPWSWLLSLYTPKIILLSLFLVPQQSSWPDTSSFWLITLGTVAIVYWAKYLVLWLWTYVLWAHTFIGQGLCWVIEKCRLDHRNHVFL